MKFEDLQLTDYEKSELKILIGDFYYQGDGTTRVAVKDDYRNSGLLSGLFNFFTTIVLLSTLCAPIFRNFNQIK